MIILQSKGFITASNTDGELLFEYDIHNDKICSLTSKTFVSIKEMSDLINKCYRARYLFLKESVKNDLS